MSSFDAGYGRVAAAAGSAVIPAEDLGPVHFVGIGGAGMSGIARIMLALGVPVSGSDAKESRTLSVLRALGARVHVGHDAANLGDAETVVVSTAISERNPELVAATERGLRVLVRAAALASVMNGRTGIAVAGTHGKTSTTSMMTVALQAAGADPSFAIGGAIASHDSNAHLGSGPHFVAEADESDGSFVLLAPTAAIVTNVEADHLDHYGTLEAVDEAFRAFVDRIVPGGFLVACAEDPGALRVVEYAHSKGVPVETYGLGADADLRLTVLSDKAGSAPGATTTVEVMRHGRRLGTVDLIVPGLHNVLNAGAALAVGLRLGFSLGDLAPGLATFSGARRRFDLKGVADGVRVVDDYAHHPTEIRATLAAARAVVGENGRLVAAFQPHRYSRTLAFGKEMGEALGAADRVLLMEVYSAGEAPIPGAGGASVAAAVPLPREDVVFEPSWSLVAGRLAKLVQPGDLVLTMGAGDITMIGPELLALLREREESAAASTD